MKISISTDLLATAGLALIAGGLFCWHPFLVIVFAGALLVCLARLMAVQEQTAGKEKE